jgi:hypothetical protein
MRFVSVQTIEIVVATESAAVTTDSPNLGCSSAVLPGLPERLLPVEPLLMDWQLVNSSSPRYLQQCYRASQEQMNCH